MMFHFKISPIENKVRQYMNTAGSHPEVKDDAAPAAVEEFTHIFELYREEHHAHVKAVNEANRVAALEKAVLENAPSPPKTESSVEPPAPKDQAESSVKPVKEVHLISPCDTLYSDHQLEIPKGPKADVVSPNPSPRAYTMSYLFLGTFQGT
jgi:hypothetical protein